VIGYNLARARHCNKIYGQSKHYKLTGLPSRSERPDGALLAALPAAALLRVLAIMYSRYLISEQVR